MKKSQKTTQIISITAVALIAIVTTATLQYQRETDSPSAKLPNDGLEKVLITLDHRTYRNLDELRNDADIVLVGSVQDAGVTVQDTPVGVSPDGRPAPGLVKTDFSVHVSKLLKGSTGEDITVTLSGGVVKNTRYVAEGSAWLSQGDLAMMYLVKGDDGKYYPLAGGSAVATKDQTGKYILPSSVSGKKAMEVSESRF